MKAFFIRSIAAVLLLTSAFTLSAEDDDAYQLDSVWIAGGENITAIQRTADWYKSVFGMLEVQRYWGGVDRGIGIELNFGMTLAQAKAAPAPKLGLARTFPGAPGAPGKDEFARVAFTVTQLDLLLRRAVDAGGAIVRQPSKQGAVMVATVRDPLGNLVDLSGVNERAAGSPVVRWHSVRIPALDAGKSAQFYRAMLDLEDSAKAASGEATLTFADVPITLKTVAKMPRPTASVSSSPLALRFRDTAALNDALKRAFDAGGRYMTEPHFNNEFKRTFTRVIDPNGNFIELSGNCRAEEVGGDAAKFICG